MAITINSNVSALNSGKNINRTTEALKANFEKLGSGKRLNSAKDGAAELAISEQLMAQLRGLNQTERNVMDGVSLVQTADGAMAGTNENLSRMRELALQAANGTLNDSDRQAIMGEYTQLREEIDRTAATTEFNGQRLLDGTANVTLQVGVNNTAADRTNLEIDAVSTDNLGDGTTTVAETSVATATDAMSALTSLDGAMEQVSARRAELGATQNTLESTTNNIAVTRANIAASNSRIADVDVANEATERARNEILSQAGMSVHAQANQLPNIALSLLG